MLNKCEVFEEGLCLGCNALDPQYNDYLNVNKLYCDTHRRYVYGKNINRRATSQKKSS